MIRLADFRLGPPQTGGSWGSTPRGAERHAQSCSLPLEAWQRCLIIVMGQRLHDVTPHTTWCRVDRCCSSGGGCQLLPETIQAQCFTPYVSVAFIELAWYIPREVLYMVDLAGTAPPPPFLLFLLLLLLLSLSPPRFARQANSEPLVYLGIMWRRGS